MNTGESEPIRTVRVDGGLGRELSQEGAVTGPRARCWGWGSCNQHCVGGEGGVWGKGEWKVQSLRKELWWGDSRPEGSLCKGWAVKLCKVQGNEGSRGSETAHHGERKTAHPRP